MAEPNTPPLPSSPNQSTPIVPSAPIAGSSSLPPIAKPTPSNTILGSQTMSPTMTIVPPSIKHEPPANIPVKPLPTSPIAPRPMTTPTPVVPSPATRAPLPPVASVTQPPANLPVINKPTPSFSSSIRTMGSDLGSIKSGTPPSGIKIEKKVPTFTIPGLPSASVPVQPSITPPQASMVSIPESGTPKWLYAVIIVVILAVGGAAFYLFQIRNAEEIVFSPTPNFTPSASPTPQPATIRNSFKSIIPLTLATSEVNIAGLSSKLSSQTSGLSSNTIKIFNVVTDTGTNYSLGDFLTALNIPHPLGSEVILNNTNWIIGVFGHGTANNLDQDELDILAEDAEEDILDSGISTPASIKRNFIVLEISDPITAQDVLNSWNTNIVKDFSKLFKYTLKAQNILAEDFYNGTNFKFIQLPDKNSGFSYAITDRFLIIASSKDSFRKIMDLLKQ